MLLEERMPMPIVLVYILDKSASMDDPGRAAIAAPCACP